MAFLILITLLTSVLFGVLPSLSSTRINLEEFLKSGGMRGVVGDGRRIRNGLVIAPDCASGRAACGSRAALAELR